MSMPFWIMALKRRVSGKGSRVTTKPAKKCETHAMSSVCGTYMAMLPASICATSAICGGDCGRAKQACIAAMRAQCDWGDTVRSAASTRTRSSTDTARVCCRSVRGERCSRREPWWRSIPASSITATMGKSTHTSRRVSSCTVGSLCIQ